MPGIKLMIEQVSEIPCHVHARGDRERRLPRAVEASPPAPSALRLVTVTYSRLSAGSVCRVRNNLLGHAAFGISRTLTKATNRYGAAAVYQLPQV